MSVPMGRGCTCTVDIDAGTLKVTSYVVDPACPRHGGCSCLVQFNGETRRMDIIPDPLCSAHGGGS